MCSLPSSSRLPSVSSRPVRRPDSAKRRSGVGRGALLVTVAATLLPVALVTAAPTASAATRQTATCHDGGGVQWKSRAIWGEEYRGSDGVTKVRMDYAGWTTDSRGEVPTDSTVRTYDGSGLLVRSSSWSGSYDYDSGSDYRSVNPANPASAPGRSKVTVTLGVDGDGYGDCTVTFTQPGRGSTPTPTPHPTPTPPPSGSGSDVYEADVVSATNSERTSRGLVALSTQACVDKYAERQAAKMAAESRMYHQELRPIMDECDLNSVGENVAYGYGSGRAVTEGWMSSPGHRANILNSRYRLLGVGAAQNNQGRWYTAQVFGSQS